MRIPLKDIDNFYERANRELSCASQDRRILVAAAAAAAGVDAESAMSTTGTNQARGTGFLGEGEFEGKREKRFKGKRSRR